MTKPNDANEALLCGYLNVQVVAAVHAAEKVVIVDALRRVQCI